MIRIASGGQIWYRFFEVAEMNLEYARAHAGRLLLDRASAPLVAAGDGRPGFEPDDRRRRHHAVRGRPDRLRCGERDARRAERRLRHPHVRDQEPRRAAADPRQRRDRRAQRRRLLRRQSAFNHADVGDADRLPSQVRPPAQGIRTATISIGDNDSTKTPTTSPSAATASSGRETFGASSTTDGDGVQDPSEPGLGGWTVFGDVNDNGVLDPGEPSTVTAPTASTSCTACRHPRSPTFERCNGRAGARPRRPRAITCLTHSSTRSPARRISGTRTHPPPGGSCSTTTAHSTASTPPQPRTTISPLPPTSPLCYPAQRRHSQT